MYPRVAGSGDTPGEEGVDGRGDGQGEPDIPDRVPLNVSSQRLYSVVMER